ncbi:sodium- and chloride-dependent taurine transporter-like [Penaeus vannamei]|uniref:sodium- and chloride-dependent taurine transporter-like n=1 Tax=Penaeus vannamei TaxID=6689 RepID=UPI00387F7519
MADVELHPLEPGTDASSPPPPYPDNGGCDDGDDGDGDDEKAETWASPLDHLPMLLSVVVWELGFLQFPLFWYINGGVFLLLYFLLLVLCGIPLLLLESFIGQFTSSNCIEVFSFIPAFKGIGYSNGLYLLLMTPYMVVYTSYSLFHLVYSFISIEQWNWCGGEWDSEGCVAEVPEGWNTTENYSAFPSFALDMPWRFLSAIFVTWVVIFFALFGGVRVLGKLMWVTAGTTIVLILALFIRGATLSGAWLGVGDLFRLESHTLADSSTWLQAIHQLFYSFCLGTGVITTMASYNKVRHNVVRDVLVVSAVKVALEIVVGLAVICLLQYLADRMQLPLIDVMEISPYLAYKTLPTVFSLMPQPLLWTCVLFVLVFFLSIPFMVASVQVLLECLLTLLPPRWRRRRWPLLLAICGAGFLLSSLCCFEFARYAFVTIEWGIPFVGPKIVCLFEVIIFAYIFGAGSIARDVEMTSNKTISYYFYFTWISVTPLILVSVSIAFLVFMFDGYLSYPAIAIGWYFLPVQLIYWCCVGDFKAKLWGPRAAGDRAAWKRFCSEHPVRNSHVHRAL